MKSLGQIFKETRESQGYEFEEVARELKIKMPFIKALEEEDFAVFPSGPMLRGFIRNYATFLELDPVEMLALYDYGHLGVNRRLPRPGRGVTFMALPLTGQHSWLNPEMMITFLLSTALLGAIFLFIYTQYLVPAEAELLLGEPQSQPPLTDDAALTLPTPTLSPTETPTPSATPTPQFYAGVTVELTITERSWVQIIIDGQRAFSGFLEPGEQRRWDGENSVAIRAGNGGGVEISVNGAYKGAMGAPGQVVDQLWERVDEAPTAPPVLDEGTPTPNTGV